MMGDASQLPDHLTIAVSDDLAEALALACGEGHHNLFDLLGLEGASASLEEVQDALRGLDREARRLLVDRDLSHEARELREQLRALGELVATPQGLADYRAECKAAPRRAQMTLLKRFGSEMQEALEREGGASPRLMEALRERARTMGLDAAMAEKLLADVEAEMPAPAAGRPAAPAFHRAEVQENVVGELASLEVGNAETLDPMASAQPSVLPPAGDMPVYGGRPAGAARQAPPRPNFQARPATPVPPTPAPSSEVPATFEFDHEALFGRAAETHHEAPPLLPAGRLKSGESAKPASASSVPPAPAPRRPLRLDGLTPRELAAFREAARLIPAYPADELVSAVLGTVVGRAIFPVFGHTEAGTLTFLQEVARHEAVAPPPPPPRLTHSLPVSAAASDTLDPLMQPGRPVDARTTPVQMPGATVAAPSLDFLKEPGPHLSVVQPVVAAPAHVPAQAPDAGMFGGLQGLFDDPPMAAGAVAPSPVASPRAVEPPAPIAQPDLPPMPRDASAEAGLMPTASMPKVPARPRAVIDPERMAALRGAAGLEEPPTQPEQQVMKPEATAPASPGFMAEYGLLMMVTLATLAILGGTGYVVLGRPGLGGSSNRTVVGSPVGAASAPAAARPPVASGASAIPAINPRTTPVAGDAQAGGPAVGAGGGMASAVAAASSAPAAVASASGDLATMVAYGPGLLGRHMLAGFAIRAMPVTNAEWADYVREGNGPAPAHFRNGAPPAGTELHPVTQVSFDEARAYLVWRASRDGLPSGSLHLPTYKHYDALMAPRLRLGRAAITRRSAPEPVNVPAGDTVDTGAGPIYHLFGNVAEWTTGPRNEGLMAGATFADGAFTPETTMLRSPPPGQTRMSGVGFRYIRLAPSAQP